MYASGIEVVNPSSHIVATGTNVHGLGTMSTETAANYVQTNNAALTNDRYPMAHNQGYATITNSPWLTNVVGYVPTNDVSVTNARPWDSPNYNTITNPPAIPSTNGLASTGYVAGVVAGYVPTNDSRYLAALTNVDLSGYVQTNDSRLTDARTPTAHNQAWSTITNAPSFLTNEALWIASSNGVVYKTETNGWVTSAHESWITNESLWIGASNGVVYKTDTNGWVVSAHAAWITNEALWIAVSNDVLYKVDTNGWTVSGHQAWITNYTETDSIATQQVAALSNQVQGITNGAALGVTAVQRAGDTMTGTLYLPAASTASNAATRYDQVSALLQASIPMYLTTNLETVATNNFQYPLKVFKSSTDFPVTVGTCTVTYANLNDYPIGMIYTNQGFTSLLAGKAIFSWWCNENTAGSASHKAEVYIWDTVRKVLVEIGEGGPVLPVPSGASSVFQSAEIPYNAVPETNLFYLAGRMKVMVLSGTPTVNFKTGPGFPCSFSFQLPNRALTEGFYQRAGDQLTGTMNANGNIITNGIFAGDAFSLTNFPASVVLTNTADYLALFTATGVLNSATGSLNTAVGLLNNATNVLNTATNVLNSGVTALNNATNALDTLARAALPKAGGTMTGPVTNLFGIYVTNNMGMFGGALNGTNGVYWTWNGTNRWILFP